MTRQENLDSRWGQKVVEVLPDDEFLKEVKIQTGDQEQTAYQVTDYSKGMDMLNYGRMFNDIAVFEVQQADGGFTEMGVHKSQVIEKGSE